MEFFVPIENGLSFYGVINSSASFPLCLQRLYVSPVDSGLAATDPLEDSACRLPCAVNSSPDVSNAGVIGCNRRQLIPCTARFSLFHLDFTKQYRLLESKIEVSEISP